jgi:integrase
MPKKRLTEEGVNKLKPPPAGKQLDYFDAGMPGLVLRINYGGAKVWRALYYLKRLDKHGKRVSIPTTHKLGRYPQLKLKEAREAARKFLADPQQGLREADAGSFKEVAETFLRMHVQANQLRWQDEVERCLNEYVYPAWQHRTFRDIRRGDVAALLDGIQERVRKNSQGQRNGAPQADKVLAIIRKIMHWYQARNDDYTCPVVQGMQRSNGSTARERWLNDAEILAVWNACSDMGSFGALTKLLLLSGQRLGKVSRMQWSDINADGVWNIPSEKREKSNVGKLQLPPAALAIIKQQPRIAGNPHVFPAGRGKGPLAAFSRGKAELDEKLGLEPWVMHDLRRTCRKLMTRARVRADVAELALGHSLQGIQKVYDDRAEYQPMIDEALQCVANEVQRILNPNVVPMPARR